MRWVGLLVAAMLPLLGCEQGGGSSGDSLHVEHLVVGTGMQPTVKDTVEVHYHGTLEDGTVFDSSVERGKPSKFPLGRVIPCWKLGIVQMKVGGKAVLTCPPDTAYGEKGTGRIPANATLTFEVELFGVFVPRGA